METTLSLQSALIAISSLITLCVVSGCMTAIMAQRKRDRVNLYFSLFCLALLLWSLAALLGPLQILRFGMTDYVRLYLLSTGVGINAVTFYIFVAEFVPDEGRLEKLLRTIAPFVLGIGLLIVWTGNAFAQNGDDFPLTTLGYLAIGAMVAYAVMALRMVIVSRDARAKPLRVPAFVLIMAYITLAISPLNQTPLAILMATGVAGWAGWTILRFQWFDPLQSISDELRVVNRDLRQTVTELASERAKSDALSRQLAAAGQIKSDFLDNLGHKLRTPLNPVVGYSELMLSGIYGELNERQLDRIQKINRNGQELIELINDMLDLNRMEAGRMKLQYTPVNLRQVVQQALTRLETRRTDKPLAIDLNLPADLPPLYADDERACQIFIKLLDNALKFTFEGSVTVRAVAARVAQGKSAQFRLPVIGWLTDGDWVISEIMDTGIGIPPEEQAKIFDEFHQVPDERTKELYGAGLGLTVARKLVELQQGTIWVKSVPNTGSTFFVALRAHPSARDAAADSTPIKVPIPTPATV
jgi:signal transduction histidine kinase